MRLASNVFDTALIFEGGGMRASYTAGVVNTLLEATVYFDYVAGVSAGSSHVADYLSRSTERTKKAFTDIVRTPRFGGAKSFLAHKGYFNSPYLYEEIAEPDGALPFDFETFKANPARLRIVSYDRDEQSTVVWTEGDINSIQDLLVRVRASSTMPFFMPPTKIDGHTYLDGGLGEGVGIPLLQAQREGFERFFIVLTRPAGYRKQPEAHEQLIRHYFWRNPHVADAINNRHIGYNKVLDEIERLEHDGKALVFRPEHMEVTNIDRDYAKLERSYQMGYEQAQRELPRWLGFLGI